MHSTCTQLLLGLEVPLLRHKSMVRFIDLYHWFVTHRCFLPCTYLQVALLTTNIFPRMLLAVLYWVRQLRCWYKVYGKKQSREACRRYLATFNVDNREFLSGTLVELTIPSPLTFLYLLRKTGSLLVQQRSVSEMRLEINWESTASGSHYGVQLNNDFFTVPILVHRYISTSAS